MSRPDEKHRFIAQLARFMCENEAGKSIALELEQKRPQLIAAMPKLAHEWAALRCTTPIIGYTSVEEAEQILTEFLC